MTNVNQGMSVEEIERVIAQRVANTIEAIAIYEAKTNLTRKSISQTEQQQEEVVENASNKRRWESNHNGSLSQQNKGHKLADTDEEIDEQKLEAHYSYMEKIQEVPTVDSGTDSEPLEKVHCDDGYNVLANKIQHSEQSESIRNTCVVEMDESNVIPDSPDMCDNDIQNDQNVVECDDEPAMIRLRDEAASTSPPPSQLLSTSCREDRPEVTLPPRKRLGIAFGPRTQFKEFFDSKEMTASDVPNKCWQKSFTNGAEWEPKAYRRLLLWYLQELDKLIDERILRYDAL
nr:hypothetical protein [Tanacetum cinerariifolium]